MNRILLGGLVAGTAFAVLATGRSGAAPAGLFAPGAAVTLPYKSPHRTEGTVTCASNVCHGSIEPWRESKVLQNEYVTWTRLDRHARAYAVLRNEQSRKIAKNLGLPKPAHESKVCLDCHAHNVPQDKRGKRFVVSDGVTCEACHGPAGNWVQSHAETGATHEQNIANGLYPTDDPGARARLCLSCHQGNADRFVTHRMMGAGHPRLSFELQTFSLLEPPHFALSRNEHPNAKRWNGVRIWAAGQAVAVAETMTLLANPKKQDGAFPELVFFDCHACHHPMSEGRWKAADAFGPRPAPGVIRLNDSNLLMLRVLAAEIDPVLGDGVGLLVQNLANANAGDGDFKAAALELRELALEIERRAATMELTNDAMARLALGIIEQGEKGHYLDYAGAEQAFMSLGSIVDFMNRSGALQDPSSANKALAALSVTLKSDEGYKAGDFQAKLAALKKPIAKTK